MGKKLEEIMQEILDESYEQKISNAQNHLAYCYEALKAATGGDKEKAVGLVLSYVKCMLAIDRDFNEKERAMMRDIFKVDAVDDCLEFGDREILESAKNLVSTFSQEERAHFWLLSAYILSADGVITGEEKLFLYQMGTIPEL